MRRRRGSADLARVISREARRRARSSFPWFEFGMIKPDMSLVLDGFRHPFPADDYKVIQNLEGWAHLHDVDESTGQTTSSVAAHAHSVVSPTGSGGSGATGAGSSHSHGGGAAESVHTHAQTAHTHSVTSPTGDAGGHGHGLSEDLKTEQEAPPPLAPGDRVVCAIVDADSDNPTPVIIGRLA